MQTNNVLSFVYLIAGQAILLRWRMRSHPLIQWLGEVMYVLKFKIRYSLYNSNGKFLKAWGCFFKHIPDSLEAWLLGADGQRCTLFIHSAQTVDSIVYWQWLEQDYFIFYLCIFLSYLYILTYSFSFYLWLFLMFYEDKHFCCYSQRILVLFNDYSAQFFCYTLWKLQ